MIMMKRLGRHGGEQVRVTGVENGHNTIVDQENVSQIVGITIVLRNTYPTRKSFPAAVPRATLVPW